VSTVLTYNQFSGKTSIAKKAANGTTLWSENYSYNTFGNLVSSTDGNGDTTRYTVNAAGLPTSSTDANGDTTSYQYDTLNRLVGETDPLLHTQAWTYDAASNVTGIQSAAVDGNGPRLTSFSFDVLNLQG